MFSPPGKKTFSVSKFQSEIPPLLSSQIDQFCSTEMADETLTILIRTFAALKPPVLSSEIRQSWELFTFSSAEDAARGVNQGLFIEHLFYRPSFFRQK